MKKTTFILIAIMLVIIGVVITTLNQAPSYATFEEAREHPNQEYHVIGKQSKTEGTVYQPEINPDQFTFYLLDSKNEKQKVVLLKSKPQDFEKAEQIVIIGAYKTNYFEAKSILMKCPSKYSDQNNSEGWTDGTK